ncbi:hypothetical protein QG516_16620 [Pedobacter gandavensis]|uniref:UbiA family prenyltransferase n=1 Tax=Pedobacter TaxID=84567 RepID=UPI001C9947B3|nr:MULTISPECIES: hypothetical protein [Pedobacter]WGQ08164.1 hypothetical protein QG516_16620 [Pedobacter gandavensis]
MVKKILFSSLDFLLFSNLFIAICAVAQGLVTYYLLHVPPDKYILAIIFFGTMGLYNFSMLLSAPKDPANSPLMRVRWIFSHHRLIISMVLISGLCLIPLALLYLSIEAQLLMLFTGVLAISYNIPFLTLDEQKIGLKNIPLIKLFLVALIWSISCVLLPIVETEHNQLLNISTGETLLMVAMRFLFIAAITIPFDVRDLFQNKIMALKTIPALLGDKKAFLFSLFLLGGYLVLLILHQQTVNLEVILLTLTIGLTGWLIYKSNPERNEYYYFLYLDGMMLLQYLLLVLLHLSF